LFCILGGIIGGGAGEFGSTSVYNKFFPPPLDDAPLIIFGVTHSFILFWTWIFVYNLFCCHINANAPVTNGDDILVPLIVFNALLLPIHVDNILTPGADKSTQEP